MPDDIREILELEPLPTKTGLEESTVTKSIRRDVLTLALNILALLFFIPASVFLLLAIVSLVTGDGFSDAAPWWAFFAYMAFLFGIPGMIFFSFARWRRRSMDSASPPPS